MKVHLPQFPHNLISRTTHREVNEMAKRHFRKYALPPWLRTIRDQGEKIIFPIAVSNSSEQLFFQRRWT